MLTFTLYVVHFSFDNQLNMESGNGNKVPVFALKPCNLYEGVKYDGYNRTGMKCNVRELSSRDSRGSQISRMDEYFSDATISKKLNTCDYEAAAAAHDGKFTGTTTYFDMICPSFLGSLLESLEIM